MTDTKTAGSGEGTAAEAARRIVYGNGRAYISYADYIEVARAYLALLEGKAEGRDAPAWRKSNGTTPPGIWYRMYLRDPEGAAGYVFEKDGLEFVLPFPSPGDPP